MINDDIRAKLILAGQGTDEAYNPTKDGFAKVFPVLFSFRNNVAFASDDVGVDLTAYKPFGGTTFGAGDYGTGSFYDPDYVAVAGKGTQPKIQLRVRTVRFDLHDDNNTLSEADYIKIATGLHFYRRVDGVYLHFPLGRALNYRMNRFIDASAAPAARLWNGYENPPKRLDNGSWTVDMNTDNIGIRNPTGSSLTWSGSGTPATFTIVAWLHAFICNDGIEGKPQAKGCESGPTVEEATNRVKGRLLQAPSVMM